MLLPWFSAQQATPPPDKLPELDRLHLPRVSAGGAERVPGAAVGLIAPVIVVT